MALFIDPPLNQDPIERGTSRWTLPWYQYFQRIQAGIATIVNGINQLTGDVTAGPGTGSQVATLATVNANVGTFGDATHVSQVTLNAKGLATAAANVAISAPDVMGIRTADPGSPVNDTAWWFRDGATPETVSLKVRIGGVTKTFPIGETT